MRKLIIVTVDQLIIVDGKPLDMRPHGGFNMANGEWALNFGGIVGEIEYTDIRMNKTIDSSFVEAHYSWAYDLFDKYYEEIAIENEIVAQGDDYANEQESENSTDSAI